MGKWSKYKRKYKKEWECDDDLKDWIMSYPGDEYRAICKICMSVMRPHYTDLLSHGKTKKHLKRCTLYHDAVHNPRDPIPLMLVEVLGSNVGSTCGTNNNMVEVPETSNLLPISSVPVPDSRDLNAKRTDYLIWEDYFMAVAFLSAQRSKDPSTQLQITKFEGKGIYGCVKTVPCCAVSVNGEELSNLDKKDLNFRKYIPVGACIVNDENKIVGIGYNGMPVKCSDDSLPWAREADDWLNTKYPYVCHAEMNAILNKNSSTVKGCRLFVALFPCHECSKLIIQSGIREVVYYSDKHAETDSTKASKRLLNLAKISFRQHIPRSEKVVVDFAAINKRGPTKSISATLPHARSLGGEDEVSPAKI